jgi:hypothetical protein
MRPIFIHAGLRSGSTYFWSKFREKSTVMAFYEPFSEDLGRATRQYLLTHGPDTWSSGHAPTAPYYQEYEPLLEGEATGIRGFHPSFSYQNYFLNSPMLDDQRAYLDSLIALATDARKQPVLGFCRSLGRAPWLKRHFPQAAHIVVVRNPVDQWLSGYHFYHSTRNPYFLINPVWCFRHPGDHPYVTTIAPQWSSTLANSALPLSTLYEIFLHVYAAGLITAIQEADLIVDMDLLSQSATYQRAIAHSVHDLSDIALDFSDCRITHYQRHDVGFNLSDVTDRAVASVAEWISGTPDARHWNMANPWTILTRMERSAWRTLPDR